MGLLAVLSLQLACHRARPQLPPSAVAVSMKRDGPVIVKTSAAESDVLPSGYVKVYLINNGRKLTLDEPDDRTTPESITVDGTLIEQFKFDFRHVRVLPVRGQIGARGRRVEIKGRASRAPITITLAVEVYDDFPTIAITAASFRNAGDRTLHLEQAVHQRLRINASLEDPTVPPYRLWSFQGSSVQ